MADISKKLLGQFAECIEAKLQQAEAVAEPAAAGTTIDGVEAPTNNSETPTAEPTAASSDDDDVLNLMDVAGGALAKRIVPVVAGVVAVIIYLITRN